MQYIFLREINKKLRFSATLCFRRETLQSSFALSTCITKRKRKHISLCTKKNCFSLPFFVKYFFLLTSKLWMEAKFAQFLTSAVTIFIQMHFSSAINRYRIEYLTFLGCLCRDALTVWLQNKNFKCSIKD